MAIGSFGRRIFETSDKRILTFSDFSYSTTPRVAEHEIIGGKSKTEYIGPGIDEITFSMVLRVDMGLNVRKELEAWRRMAANGTAERLIIGRTRLGGGMWYIPNFSENWNLITNQGAIISASTEITLKEYY